MTTTTDSAGISCDLVSNSVKHREFLHKVHSLGERNLSTVKSFRRYRDLWLPLVNDSHDDDDGDHDDAAVAVMMVPPPDVAWLWHCHRLAPFRYESYVRVEFGKVLEANPPFAMQLENDDGKKSNQDWVAAAEFTRSLWQEKYPNEPFFIVHDDGPTLDDARDNEDSLALAGFDLLSSTERQSTFLWQVSGARFNDPVFLQEGKDNYVKFLKLRPRAQSKGIVLVPTYQIDLMWHTHILSSISLYNHDCEALIGSRLHHDDSLNDRSDGGLLDRSFRATAQLWRSAYGDDYIVHGGMYRGEPPLEYYERDWDATADSYTVSEKHCQSQKTQGASSTPTASPIAYSWARPSEVLLTASNGEKAFIGVPENGGWDNLPYRPNYILGKSTANTVGYHHVETREAHEMIARRIEGRISDLQTEIAFDRACWCALIDSTIVPRKRQYLQDYSTALNITKERILAVRPHGRTPSSTNAYCSSDGRWLYPDVLWEAAGGACGGETATCHYQSNSHTPGGGGCGSGPAGGGCGSGHAGGGCGGGGCGGGGCGGGGCGGGG